MNTCPHCGAEVPLVATTAETWKAVTAALTRGSRTIAEAEISSVGLADRATSARFIDHVLACVYSWPFEGELQAILHHIDQAFGMAPRPQHFTKFDHCEECAEHDRMLRSRTVKTITRTDLGTLGWDPINFTTDQGWAYYFPALARFAVMPPIWRDRGHYAIFLANDLSHRRFDFCARDRRHAVAGLIEWIATNEEQLSGGHSLSHGLWQSWSDGARLWRSDYLL
jgi:hypothetical protein